MTIQTASAWRVPAAMWLAASASVLVVLAATGCSTHAAPTAGGPPPAEVSIAQVVSRKVHLWDDFTGRITAVQSVELRPRVSGYIDRIAFTEGQQVHRGDLLFVIDPRPYQAALDQAQAALEHARSQAKLAQAEDARGKSLVDAKVISREDYETRQSTSAQSEASVRGAEAAVDTARLNLQFTQVRSPIDGRASRAMVTAGNLAQADTTVLTSIVSLDPVYVSFEGDEQTYLRYNQLARQGQRDASRNPVRVGLANEVGYPHMGTLDFVDNQVDANTGTIRERAVLPNPDHTLTPGLFARVQMEDGAEFNALLIDDKAVLTDQDRKYVYVLGKGNAAQRKDVTLGRTVDGLRVVTAGLEPTDQVVVDGVQKVFFPGMALKATTVPMQPPPAKPNGVAAR